VLGLALWGKSREYGPNLGELDFVGELDCDTISYSWAHADGKLYRASLRFDESGLTVSEENSIGVYGMNVNFSGQYARAT
jgi:hypothetical protein